ncbi:MAG: phage tail protein [Ramlibacter sp.]|nr:phage tail protein [Ramlibacter sp.]
MAQPYVGEIRLFAGNFAPAGWMFCSGQILPISENDTLFNLIGTTYGGDGQSTFALPDMQSRIPIHQGNGYVLAETAGVESVTLTVQQMPAHNHTPIASTNGGNVLSPANAVLAAPTSSQAGLMSYSAPGTANVPMVGSEITSVGGNQPHDNMQPYLCISYIISLFGVFPSPT